ncbi:MAG: DUF72 domain-containing protein [Bacteroidota bacterium]
MRVRRKTSADDLALFDDQPEFAKKYATKLRRLASRGVWFGTSSWVYTGWRGIVYRPSIKSEAELRRVALREYANVFPTACADWSFYDFPEPELVDRYRTETPEDFQLAFKVTDLITMHRYPFVKDRWGNKAGQLNPDFLNARKFVEEFLRRLETLQARLGPIILEFSPIRWSDITPKKFLHQLDQFLAELPSGFRYSVEIRNVELLTNEYLEILHRHGVAHVLNSWTAMPSIDEQLEQKNTITADFAVVRALLKPGRDYQEAVNLFRPYQKTREILPDVRKTMEGLAVRFLQSGKTVYFFVNNRLEGNAPFTIAAVVDGIETHLVVNPDTVH